MKTNGGRSSSEFARFFPLPDIAWLPTKVSTVSLPLPPFFIALPPPDSQPATLAAVTASGLIDSLENRVAPPSKEEAYGASDKPAANPLVGSHDRATLITWNDPNANRQNTLVSSAERSPPSSSSNSLLEFASPRACRWRGKRS